MPRIRSDIPGALDIPAIPIPPSSPEIHVLAVDDSAIDRKVVERLLMISAFKVTTAESGARALEILGIRNGDNSLLGNANSINLILTDYCMPGMTGYDLLKRVKGIPALKDIPVIIMSSENVASRINRCLAEGAEDFILKPLKMSDMKRLKGLICQTRPRTAEPSGVSLSVKRKILSDSLVNENAERRPRLEVVTVT